MDKVHYYVLIHDKTEEVLGFFQTKEDAEQAKSKHDIPLNELKIIETDSNLKKI